MKREFVINSLSVNDDSEAFVIAEIGHNHQGSVDTAKEMFLTAKECGASAVKLQKRDNRSLFTRKLYESPYVSETSYGDTYGEHREALEFGENEYRELADYAKEIGIIMFATAFDLNSVDFLAKLDMPLYKVASADLKNSPLLKHLASVGKPLIVSTGGGTMEDVQRAYDVIMPINPNLCLLQCTASYPVERYEELNLNVITTFRERFKDVVVGLSDHESGIAMAVAAFTLGARVIEKHFTLNRAWRGTDHSFSLAPVGLRKLVRNLRRTRLALGDGVKRAMPSEKKPLLKMSKKLVASRSIPAGAVLSHEDVAIKSPGDGLPPYELDNVLGKTVVRALELDDNIAFDNLR